MDPSQAVDAIVNLAKWGCEGPIFEQPKAVVSEDVLGSSILSLRCLLQQMLPPCKSREKLVPFCQLISIQTIELLLKCRRGRWSTSHSWPNIVVLELANYCSEIAFPSRRRYQSRETNVQKVFRRISLDSCAQIPASWKSCLDSLSRHETSSMARKIILRLLYLATVLQPQISQNAEDISGYPAYGIPAELSQRLIEMVHNTTLVLDEESLVIIAALMCTSSVSMATSQLCPHIGLAGSQFDSVREMELVSTVFEKDDLIQHFGTILFEHSDVFPWLIIMRETANTDDRYWIDKASRCWLFYSTTDNIGARISITRCSTQFPNAFSAFLVDTIRSPLLEGSYDRGDISHLIAAAVSSLLQLRARNAQQWQTLVIPRDLGDHLLAYFFRLDGVMDLFRGESTSIINHFTRTSKAQEDIIELLSAISESTGYTTESKWLRVAEAEALRRLQSELADPGFTLSNAEVLLMLLTYLYYWCHLAPISADGLRTICLQLLGHMDQPLVNENSQLTALFFFSFVDSSPQHPLLLFLCPHIELLQYDLNANLRVPQNLIHAFAQHILLLADKHLLPRCDTEQLALSVQYLFEAVFLVLQSFQNRKEKVASLIGELCDALTTLLHFVPSLGMDWITSSPWTFMARVHIQRLIDGQYTDVEGTSFKCSVESFLKLLNRAACGETIGSGDSSYKRQINIKRDGNGRLKYFLE